MPDLAGLVRAEDREADAGLGQDFQGLQIHRGFRQPHAFRLSAKAPLEIAHAPEHLGALVAAVRQRQDHVVVGLRHGGAVSGEVRAALAVGVEDGVVDLRARGPPSRPAGSARS